MPELPEVECLARSVRAYLDGFSCRGVRILQPSLREAVNKAAVTRVLKDQKILGVTRRSKYLLMETAKGTCVVHLGMSGQLLAASSAAVTHKHTHAVFEFVGEDAASRWLHYVDPRRFGLIGGIAARDLATHRWFVGLGPEPLTCADLGLHLFEQSRGRKQPVKVFLMDAARVVGVGNIYASESLFRAGISPLRGAGTLTAPEFIRLGGCIKETLLAAIEAGGTTIRDYRDSSGSPGYFAVRLAVYDRAGEPCIQCGKPVQSTRLGGRSTFYCAFCQS